MRENRTFPCLVFIPPSFLHPTHHAQVCCRLDCCQGDCIPYLLEHHSEAGDGGNFKKATFTQAAVFITPLHKRGGTKDHKALQNKWAAFGKLYRVVKAIQTVSGWHWDDKHGASIGPDEAATWDAYVKAHPEAKPFRNKGFVPLKAMEEGTDAREYTWCQCLPPNICCTHGNNICSIG
ncbi:hypothetical protein B0H34DRAFT_655091 [Crassisporium funariophilum]|nr:hypothetical protein B0H34DRAFT_655091 [Crassisporium funariophilum]